MSSISMFILSNEITNNNRLSFFISIYYSMNLYTAIIFHTPKIHIPYLYGITPLLVLILIKMENSVNYRRRLLYLIIYLILYLTIIRTFNMFVIYLIIIPLIVFIVNFGIKIPIKRFLRCCILTCLMIVLTSSPFLFPLGSTTTAPLPFTQGSAAPINIAYTQSAVKVALGQKLKDSIRFIRTYAWERCPYDESFGGVLAYSFAKHYQQNPILIFISNYPILIVFYLFFNYYNKLQRLDRYRVIGLLLLATISLFLTTPSLTAIGELLYENKIYIFRAAWKYFSIPYILCLSLILALFLRQLASYFQRSQLLSFLLILFLIHSVYILPAHYIYGKTIKQSLIVETPKEYIAVADFLNQQDDEFRILPLPLSTDWTGFTPYVWGYVGPDILYTLTDKPLIDKFDNMIAPMEYLELTNKLVSATPHELLQYCQTLNVKYILVRNDVDLEHPYKKVNNSPEYYRDVLENSDVIKSKHVFRDLVLYELESYTPRIFLVPANVSGNNLIENFYYSSYQPQSINYLHFVENLSTPIILESLSEESVQSYSMNLKFTLEEKNVNEDDWRIINHVPIQTNLFKISISPKGVLYVFAYLKEGGYWSMTKPFKAMKGISTIKLDFKNGNLSVYLNNSRIGDGIIEPPNMPLTIRIGSNMQGNEKYVGKIYDIEFSVNNENIVSIPKLFSSYPNYVEKEIIYKLHLFFKEVEWRKISPTKYIVTFSKS
ncbi:MAG: hypothetical protein ACFFDN_25550, partial [Candidatus Hodarchaeota archaeon]